MKTIAPRLARQTGAASTSAVVPLETVGLRSVISAIVVMTTAPRTSAIVAPKPQVTPAVAVPRIRTTISIRQTNATVLPKEQPWIAAGAARSTQARSSHPIPVVRRMYARVEMMVRGKTTAVASKATATTRIIALVAMIEGQRRIIVVAVRMISPRQTIAFADETQMLAVRITVPAAQKPTVSIHVQFAQLNLTTTMILETQI